MIIQGELPFLTEKNHIISIVGAGGKTTLMYALAERFVQNGARTLVSTTTHIYRPEERLWAKSPKEVRALWAGGTYAVAGLAAGEGKLKSLPQRELERCMRMADIVLLEADGAKKMPCKVPAAHEPVIPDVSDIVIGVMGMSAYGRPAGEVCFRQELAAQLFGLAPQDIMTAERMAKILASREGTRKAVGDRDYYVVLNQCDSAGERGAGERIIQLLRAQGIDRCVLACLSSDPPLYSARK